jgi:hypothetical protein
LRRFGKVLATAILSVLFLQANSLAILDQQHEPALSIFTVFNDRPVAQTFTVGITGILTGLEIYVSQSNPSGNLIVEIQQGLVEGPVVALPTVLTSFSVPVASWPSSNPGGTGPAFIWIDLPGNGVNVTQGDELAIVLHSNDFAGMLWQASSPDSQPQYLGGKGMQFHPEEWVGTLLNEGSNYLPDRWETNFDLADYGFRTYVEPVPEPATILLFGIGMIFTGKKLSH